MRSSQYNHVVHICINDEGALICFAKGTSIYKSLFINRYAFDDNNSIEQKLDIKPGTIVYLYINTKKQTYFTRNIAPMSWGNSYKIAKRVLDNELSPFLNTLLPLPHIEKNSYLFVAAHYNQIIKKILSFITQRENPIAEVYFLPLELSLVVKVLREQDIAIETGKKKYFPFFKSKYQPEGLEILITYHKGGVIRITSFYKEKALCSDSISYWERGASNYEERLKQALEKVIEFNAKVGQGNIKVYTIAPREINLELQALKIESNLIWVTSTPSEISKIKRVSRGFHKDIEASEQYADLVIFSLLNRFARISNPVELDNSSYIGKFRIHKYFNIVCRFSILLLVFLCFMNLMDIWNTEQNYKELRSYNSILNEQIDRKKHLRNLKREEFTKTIISGEVTEALNVYTYVLTHFINPVAVLQLIGNAVNKNYNVNYVNWYYYSENLLPNQDAKKSYNHYGYIVEFGLESNDKDNPLDKYYETTLWLSKRLKNANFTILPVVSHDLSKTQLKLIIEVWR